MRTFLRSSRHFALAVSATVTLAAAVGCTGRSSQSVARTPERAGQAGEGEAARAEARRAIPRRVGRVELADGLVVDRVPLRVVGPAGQRDAAAAADSLLTLLRIDPQRWDLRLLTAASDGGARTAPEWARAFDLAAVINAALYLPDQRSIGLMIDGETVHNPRDNRRLAGFLAFHPRSAELPAVRVFGRDCPGFQLDEVRASYSTIIQNYRMLDCDRRPVPWKDQKQYAIAGVGVDTANWVVFLHCSTPMRVHELNLRLADAELGLAAAVFVEGGHQASLVAEGTAGRVEETGSAGTAGTLGGFARAFWPIPNVLGVVPHRDDPAPAPPRRG